MALERTVAIIKPDAVKHRAIGAILQQYEEAGFNIVEMKLLHLSRADAEKFYAVHRARPFFQSLVTFMISGPVVVVLLELAVWRTGLFRKPAYWLSMMIVLAFQVLVGGSRS